MNAVRIRCLLATVTGLLLLAGCAGGTKTVTVKPPAPARSSALPSFAPKQIAGLPACTPSNFFMQCAAGATGQGPPVFKVLPRGGGWLCSTCGVDTYGNPASYLQTNFAITYVPYSGKGWTRAGLQAWIGRGHKAGLVFEASASRAEDGYNQGVADARYSLSYANALGFPSYSVIYFAVDTETSAAAVHSYFQGAHSVLGSRTGVYGSYYVVAGLENVYHLVTPRTMWQTVAWSYGHRSNACLYQSSINGWLNGQSVDYDENSCADFGQFPLSHAPVCFGKHAVGNATCRAAHKQVAKWQAEVAASKQVYRGRGCPGLVSQRTKLVDEQKYFQDKLQRYPHVKTAHRRAALASLDKRVTVDRRAISGRKCDVFDQRVTFFDAKIRALERKYA